MIAPEVLIALRAAKDALRSYQHGNSAPDLAEQVADHIEKVLAAAPAAKPAEAEALKACVRFFHDNMDTLFGKGHDVAMAAGATLAIRAIGVAFDLEPPLRLEHPEPGPYVPPEQPGADSPLIQSTPRDPEDK